MADANTEEPVPAEEVELDEKDKKKKKKKRYGGLGGVGSCPTAHGGSFGMALGSCGNLHPIHLSSRAYGIFAYCICVHVRVYAHVDAHELCVVVSACVWVRFSAL